MFIAGSAQTSFIAIQGCRWRTPHTLQIGVDPVLARLDGVSEGDARLIDALTIGVPRSGLDMLADLAGVDQRRVDQLLAALASALGDEPQPTATPLTVVGVMDAIAGAAGAVVSTRITGGSSRHRAWRAAIRRYSGHLPSRRST